MPINHATVKAKGDIGTHDEWNADHVNTWPSTPRSSATFVVAASDSNDPDLADYQCDGTADEVQINQAIQALPASGGKIQLLEGTYEIAAKILVNINYVQISGTGVGTFITLANNADDHMVQVGDADNDNTATQFFLNGIWFNGNKANNAGVIYGLYLRNTSAQIRDCGIGFCNNDNIYSVPGIYDINLIRVRSYVSGNNGITIQSDSSTVSKCEVFSNVGHGIYFASDATGANGMIVCKINENMIYSNGGDGVQLTNAWAGAPGLRTCVGNTISGNHSYGNAGWGININTANVYNSIVMENFVLLNTAGTIQDNGVNTLPNGAMGTNTLALDDHNQMLAALP